MPILLSHGMHENGMVPGALSTNHTASPLYKYCLMAPTTPVHHFLQFPTLWTSRTDKLDILL